MLLSVLEQVPLFDGHPVRETLEDTVTLAQGLEEGGFHRFWFAEHHDTPSFLSSAPDLMMMHVLDATRSIHVGSGGVMAMHYGSLQLAERFSTLAALHPGRVDMGLGRAPGGAVLAAHALNQGHVIGPDSINALIVSTVELLRNTVPEEHPYSRLSVTPPAGELPEVWLLGSSGQSAAWAGEHDLNYAYAQFFTGSQDPTVMDVYRAHLPKDPIGGRTLSALSVSAAPTREEAIEQALPAAEFRSSLRSGRQVTFRDPSAIDTRRRAELVDHLAQDDSMIVGTYDEVAQRIRSFVEDHGVEEVMLISYIADVRRKLRQYQELARRVNR